MKQPRTPVPWSEWDLHCPFWQKVCSGPSVLMLDYDGTLAPFHRDRMKALPYSGVEECLQQLLAAARVRLVLVTGRPASELQRLFPFARNVGVWGDHGREYAGPDSEIRSFPLGENLQQTLHDICETVDRAGFGSTIDAKSGSIAFHWRGLPESDQERLRSLITAGFERQSSTRDSFELLEFAGGLEVRGTDRSKADAVLDALGRDPSTAAAYLGDDITDEDAFRAMPDDAVSILVRDTPRESLANFFLQPPEQLIAFLQKWGEAAGQDPHES